ncbi:MAG: GNAT family N-acetyltransferase [Acidimicrobiales bacterium]|jgi:N-acetylglutamate synthase-like GNAT family acetyltransferase
MIVRPAAKNERAWIVATLRRRWGSTVIVTQSRECDASVLDALVAIDETAAREDPRVGLLTYRFDERGLEVVTIDALRLRAGIGGALLDRVTEIVRGAGAERIWLITTNDNLGAISFYESRGFCVVAVHKGAVDRARALKESIPLVASNGIEIHDEIELALEVADPAP